MSDLIERLADLNARLKLMPSGVGLGLQDRQLLNDVHDCIRELEADREKAEEKLADIEAALQQRAETAEAERERLKEELEAEIEVLAEQNSKLAAERDGALAKLNKYFSEMKIDARAIEAATIEECVEILGSVPVNILGDCSREAAIQAIRALVKPKKEGV